MGAFISVYAMSLSSVNFTSYIILLHVAVVRPSSGKNILLARITELTTGPLFYNIANIIVIVFYN
jgi:hypothetical protein